jgi:hypothetical protein
MAVEILVNG